MVIMNNSLQYYATSMRSDDVGYALVLSLLVLLVVLLLVRSQ